MTVPAWTDSLFRRVDGDDQGNPASQGTWLQSRSMASTWKSVVSTCWPMPILTFWPIKYAKAR